MFKATPPLLVTFSAKERDVETGLSYFGSRYYSSDLGIWLSVDPQAAKYPSLSNYVYCSNNPIKVIDPNGEDEWEVNESGYIRHIQNDKPDRIYAVSGTKEDEWGDRKTDVVPLDVDKSIMSTIVSKGENTTFSNINNRDKMDELFNFLADNTDVEWTQISVHDRLENKIDHITTSHENINTKLTTYLKNLVGNTSSQGLLDVFKHSHPNHYTGDNPFYAVIYPYTCNVASPGDKGTKDRIISRNGYVRTQPLFILRNRMFEKRVS